MYSCESSPHIIVRCSQGWFEPSEAVPHDRCKHLAARAHSLQLLAAPAQSKRALSCSRRASMQSRVPTPPFWARSRSKRRSEVAALFVFENPCVARFGRLAAASRHRLARRRRRSRHRTPFPLPSPCTQTASSARKCSQTGRLCSRLVAKAVTFASP